MNRREFLERTKSENLAAARRIADTAEAAGRDFTQAERDSVTRHVDQAKAADSEIKGLAGDSVLVDELNALGRRSGRRDVPRGDGTWAKAMDTYLGRIGAKALVPAGGISVPSISGGIIASEDRPRSILELIPFTPLSGTDQFAYWRETLRTHNAAPVARGAKKPTSIYTVEKVEDRVRVIAHISESIDRVDLSDTELLRAYLEGALREGVMMGLEDQVINGDGTGEEFDGVLVVSGSQAQAWDTDLLVTARKAVTKLENLKIDLSGAAWAIDPADWERYELLSSANHFLLSDPGTGGEHLPVDRARRQLWGYPVVPTTVVPGGTAILGDWRGSIEIKEREDVQITWSEGMYDPDRFGVGDGGTAFEANQVNFRAEGRWGLAVLRPPAFVEVDLTA